MKYLKNRDINIRSTVKILETKKQLLKQISFNTSLSKFVRWKAFLKLYGLSLKSSTVKLTNRCILTNRKKRFNKHYNFSRIMFLRLAKSKQLTDIKKINW